MQMCRRGKKLGKRTVSILQIYAALISGDSFYPARAPRTNKHYLNARMAMYLVTARHETSFYLADKDAHMSQGFTDALSTKKRIDRDEKCAGIIYLWVSLGNEARLKRWMTAYF